MGTAARIINIAGSVAVALYAVLGVLTILVWNPLAARPGMELNQIYQRMEAANEPTGLSVVVAFGIVGVGLSLAAAVTFWRRDSDAPLVILAVYLALIGLGSVAYFWASFPMGMGLADTFGIGGADHTGVGYALICVSLLSFLGLVPVLVSLGTRRAGSGSAPSEP